MRTEGATVGQLSLTLIIDTDLTGSYLAKYVELEAGRDVTIILQVRCPSVSPGCQYWEERERSPLRLELQFGAEFN